MARSHGWQERNDDYLAHEWRELVWDVKLLGIMQARHAKGSTHQRHAAPLATLPAACRSKHSVCLEPPHAAMSDPLRTVARRSSALCAS